MSEQSISQQDSEEPDNICVCYTCIHKQTCSDATPTVVICQSYECNEDNNE